MRDTAFCTMCDATMFPFLVVWRATTGPFRDQVDFFVADLGMTREQVEWTSRWATVVFVGSHSLSPKASLFEYIARTHDRLIYADADMLFLGDMTKIFGEIIPPASAGFCPDGSDVHHLSFYYFLTRPHIQQYDAAAGLVGGNAKRLRSMNGGVLALLGGVEAFAATWAKITAVLLKSGLRIVAPRLKPITDQLPLMLYDLLEDKLFWQCPPQYNFMPYAKNEVSVQDGVHIHAGRPIVAVHYLGGLRPAVAGLEPYARHPDKDHPLIRLWHDRYVETVLDDPGVPTNGFP